MNKLINTEILNKKVDITHANTIERVISVEIKKIKPSNENFYSINKTELEILKLSISENGQLDPILLTDEFEIISGHRRFEAMRELGFSEVKGIIIRTESDVDKRVLLIEANRYRNKSEKDKLKEIEIAIELVKEKKKLNPNYKGRTAELAAEMLGISAATIKRSQAKKKKESREPKNNFNSTLKFNANHIDDVVKLEKFLNQQGYDFQLKTKLK